MPKGKHLTLDERQKIHLDLNENLSFKQIADNIGKDLSTVSKEVRNHIIPLQKVEKTYLKSFLRLS